MHAALIALMLTFGSQAGAEVLIHGSREADYPAPQKFRLIANPWE